MDIHGYTTYNLGGGGKDFICSARSLEKWYKVDEHIINWVVLKFRLRKQEKHPDSDIPVLCCFVVYSFIYFGESRCLKRWHPKRILVFQPSIFSSYDSFREGTYTFTDANIGVHFPEIQI